MNKIDKLPPFKRFCVTIGNLPSSYVDSMSYYECLMWLCNYLQNTVVPAVNENAEAVNELINWFNNLNVQDEIDHKLDEMVESGQLQEIISEYLNSTAVFGFDTVSDMVSSTNLINGSYARTCGKTTFNDGKGSLYKIRTVTNEDVVDGDKIIAMNNESLIAVRIFDNITDEKILCIGDSFIGEYPTNNWGLKLKNIMNLGDSDIKIIGEGGAGIYNTGASGHTFLTLLQSKIDTIPNKALYTKIIIGGGYNDGNATSKEQIVTPMIALINYCKQQFPNAKIYFSCFGWNMKYDGTLFRNRLVDYVIPAYKSCINYGAIYLSNTEFCYRDFRLYESDDPVNEACVHPNDDGQQVIASAIYQALNTSYTPEYRSSNIAFDASTSDDITNASCYFSHNLTPYNHVINLNGNFTVSKTYNPANGLLLDLGLMPDPLLRQVKDLATLSYIKGRFYDNASNVYDGIFLMKYTTSGHITVFIPRGLTSANTDIATIVLIDTVTIDRYVW